MPPLSNWNRFPAIRNAGVWHLRFVSHSYFCYLSSFEPDIKAELPISGDFWRSFILGGVGIWRLLLQWEYRILEM